jgi:hypothetical protein
MLCNLDRATVQHLGIGITHPEYTGKPICWLPAIMDVHEHVT